MLRHFSLFAYGVVRMQWWEELDAPLLGRYQIERCIGQGGMADVWLAHDVRFEARKVAIKTPNLDKFPADQVDELLERFHREVKRQANDSIFGTVRLLDAGEVTDARGVRRQVLVMDYLPGGSLGSVLAGTPGQREHRQTLGDVNRWLPQVAATLDRLHARKILHRDVKPDNILFDQDGNPFLADLGIATSLDEVAGAGSLATLAGTMGPGSPGYQAPETLRGEKLACSDQFSLAVTVYEALGGVLPMPASSRDGWIMALANWQPKDLREHLPELPAAAAVAVARALSSEPQKRFLSCSEFAEALVQATHAKPAPLPTPMPAVASASKRPPASPVPVPVPAQPPRKGGSRWKWWAPPLLVVLLLLGWGTYKIMSMRSIAVAPEIEALSINNPWSDARNAHTAILVRLGAEFAAAAGEPETMQSRLSAELDLRGAAEQAAASLLAFNEEQQKLSDHAEAFVWSNGNDAQLDILKADLRNMKAAGDKVHSDAEVLATRTALAAKQTTKAAQVPGAPSAALAADAAVSALEQDVASYVGHVAQMRAVTAAQAQGLLRLVARMRGEPMPAAAVDPAAVATSATGSEAKGASEPAVPLPACTGADHDSDGVPDCRDLCETPARQRATVARSGCPANASMRLFFPRDNAELADLSSALDEVAAELKANPSKLVAISGHGDAQEVKSVSEMRALVVFEYLVSKGVRPDRLLPPVGYGDQFASRSSDAAAMDLDRRVEVQIEP